MNKFIYTLKHKSSGIPLQDVAFSRKEARDMKRMYERRDGTKYQIVRYAPVDMVR